MTPMDQIRSGLNQAWEGLAEGWHQLRDRAAHALTRFTPVRHNAVETADEQAMLRASRWGVLAAEIEEKGDALVVKLEAPGMEGNNFDISVVQGTLVVSGEKRIERSREEGRYHVMECAYGRFQRVLPLPVEVDEGRATANYRRGVLTITLPKQARASSRRIEVKQG